MTACVSVATAVALWLLLPEALALPSPAQLREVNDALRKSETKFRLLAEQLTERNADLELSRQHFDAAVDNMSQGLIFFGRDLKIIFCNQRFREIYQLSREDTRPGTSLSSILEHRIGNGTFLDVTLANFFSRRETVFRAGRFHDITDELCDGRTISINGQSLPDGSWVTTHEDITQRRRAEATVLFLARYDLLTHLSNRVMFNERLDQALLAVDQGNGCAVLCVDLDRFKLINDTLGHAVGDGLLQAVAEMLRTFVQEVDTVARLGGDEFAIIQRDVTKPEDAEFLAQRIIEAFEKPFDVDGHQLTIGTSVGVALAPGDGTSSATLLKNADMALYLAKAESRGTVRFFEPEMDARIQLRRALEMDLRAAVARDEFEIHYQPIVNLASGRVSGFEALLRWNHPVRGLVSPAEFIPLAEETGMIVAIGSWVLRTACIEAQTWPAAINLAVNLSPIQFQKGDVMSAVTAALDASCLRPERLELEITESVLMQDSIATLTILHRFRSMGIAVALDDFGTGYSSLSYLRRFPFDKIKIDQCFVHDILHRHEAMSIVRAVTHLGHDLRMRTTAEGVETQEQLDMLRDEGCTEAQGHLFSRPKPASEVPSMIESGCRAAISSRPGQSPMV
jgi:diguanylate cyclase (GGDEF)-like protein